MLTDKRLRDLPDAPMEGLRVLALPSSGVAPEKHYIFWPLRVAKEHWNWRVDILCSASTPNEYEKLIAPSGQFFVRPTLSEHLPWEDDPKFVAELDLRIRDTELATGVPTGQVVLAADSKIGRGFVDPVISLSDNRTARRVDEDNLEPYRIVRRLFHFAEEMLDASKPDLVYSYEWAKPWLFTVWLAARRRGIPCIVVRRSKLRSDHCFVTADRLMFNVAARAIAAAKNGSSASVSDAANNYIRSFREQPKMVKYVEAKWTEKAKRTWLNWHLQWGRSNASSMVRSVRGRGRAWHPVKQANKLYDFNRQAFRAWRHQRFMRAVSVGELANLKYVYFPLHKETDLPLNFQAAAWFDQRFTVRLLASVMPNGYRLLVREHRHNYGMRPAGYYQELSRLPNVMLIDAYDSQFKYVKHAALVVTENGSTGWEGLLLRRKVLTLSKTFYDGAGLARKLDRNEDLGAEMVELLGSPDVEDVAEHDRALGRMIDAEFETTFDPQDAKATVDYFQTAITPLVTSKRPARSS